MNNIMVIDGYRAIIQYDPDIEMFRGEFTGLCVFRAIVTDRSDLS